MNKKVLIVLLATVLVSGFAAAQTTDSASLFLSGVVGEYVNIDVTPTAAATNLLLSITQTTPVPVATVVETSNTAYTVTVASANSFNFNDGGGNAQGYTLHYDGTAFTADGQVSSGTSANNINRPVGVSYTASVGLPPGVYTDTLTFTITSP